MGLSRFTKQYKVFGAKLGGLKELAMHTAFYVTIINFTLIAVTAYGTTLRDPLLQTVPWITFPIFIAALILLVLIGMVFEYKFVYPSIWAFRNEQQYKHSNPIRKDIELVRKDIKLVMNKLAEKEKVINKRRLWGYPYKTRAKAEKKLKADLRFYGGDGIGNCAKLDERDPQIVERKHKDDSVWFYMEVDDVVLPLELG